MGRIRESDGTNETIWSLQIRPMVPNVVHKYVGWLELKDEYASIDDEHHLETILTGFTQMSV